MAWFGPTNQLIQIDTGKAQTYLYNKSQSPIQVYADIGETQVPGQRYFSIGVGTGGPSTPFGAPGVYQLVYYKSTGNPAPAAAPAPVYWATAQFDTVTGVESESYMGLNSPAGYLCLNTTALPTLTPTLLNGALCLVQVAGVVLNAISPAAVVAGDWLIAAAGNFTAARVAAGTAPGYKPFGRAMTAVSGGLCNILLDCDVI